MRASRLLSAFAVAILLGCPAAPDLEDPNVTPPTTSLGEETERTLRETFPEQAALILDGDEADLFSEAADGFDVLPNNPALGAAYRRGLVARLPLEANGPVRFSVGDEFSVEVRETGATGKGSLSGARGSAVVYKRPAGASIWVANEDGVEEWLLVSSTWQGGSDRAQERVIAEWSVTGARMEQRDAHVALIDDEGVARMQVSAPAAYAASGKPVETRLEARGERLSLIARTEGGMLLIDPLWQATGTMTAREHHTATLLPDGRVMLVGGRATTSTTNQAAFYNPNTGTWSEQAVNYARWYHTATRLLDGRVFIAGGRQSGSTTVTNRTEIYSNGSFANGPTLGSNRHSHTATLLPDGRVMIVGGNSTATGGTLNTVQFFNPATNAMANGSNLNYARVGHTATLIADGRVVVIGGTGATSSQTTIEHSSGAAWTQTTPSPAFTGRYGHSATLIAPNKILVVGGRSGNTILNNTFILTLSGNTATTEGAGTLVGARYNHTATLLPNGKVLVTGGLSGTSDPSSTVATAELWDPVTKTWTAQTAMSASREGHTATLLHTGKVLVSGGKSSAGTVQNSSQLFDATSRNWSATGSLNTARSQFAIIRHSSGFVGALGGTNASGAASAATERWDPSTGTWTAGPAMTQPRIDPTATELRDGSVLVVGGSTGGGVATSSAEVFNGSGFSAVASMATARFAHTATMLPNGLVLVAGGLTGPTSATPSAELYDPATGTWSAAGSMATARGAHTATLMRSGKVLVTGGYNGSTPTNTAEIYDPATDTWTSVANLPAARYRHAATLLPTGDVLVTGGLSSPTAASNTVYLFNGTSWLTRAAMTGNRALHTATLLFSGHVLVAGGTSGAASVDTVQIYDPAFNLWETGPVLPAARSGHGAVLLPDGRVLVAGGRGSSNAHPDSYLFSEGRDEVAGSRPVLAQPPSPTVTRGGALTLTGFRFQGTSNASSSGQPDSPSNNPILIFERLDEPGTEIVPVTTWNSTQLKYTLPSTMIAATYAVRVVVNGISSVDPITIRVLGDPLGSPCTSGVSCESGFCADGVCCETACNSGCAACKTSLHGNPALADGYCAPALPTKVCRAAAGACDEAETCDGTSFTCPADVMKPDGTECVHDFNPTCKGFCDGTSASCQL